MKKIKALLYMLALCLFSTAPLHAEDVLTDDSLEKVTARGIGVTSPSPGEIAFDFDGKSQGLIGLAAYGNAKVVAAQDSGTGANNSNVINNSSVNLSGDAQKYLNALVNVNAANAWVQVLMNLTVINNSTVNAVTQGNLSQPILVP